MPAKKVPPARRGGGVWKLFWKRQRVGTITDVAGDFPWRAGTFTPAARVSRSLRAALEWMAAAARSDDPLPDPPFPEEVLSNWRVAAPDGQVSDTAIPVIDFDQGTITWR